MGRTRRLLYAVARKRGSEAAYKPVGESLEVDTEERHDPDGWQVHAV